MVGELLGEFWEKIKANPLARPEYEHNRLVISDSTFSIQLFLFNHAIYSATPSATDLN